MLIKIVLLIPLLLISVPFFFGFKANIKRLSITTRVLWTAGVSVCIFTAIYTLAYGHELSLNQAVACFTAYIIGLGVMILTPIFAALDSLANGEPFEGPYQQMTPEQKEVFWKRVRTATKLAAGVYENNARKKGKDEHADVTKKIRRLL